MLSVHCWYFVVDYNITAVPSPRHAAQSGPACGPHRGLHLAEQGGQPRHPRGVPHPPHLLPGLQLLQPQHIRRVLHAEERVDNVTVT